MSNAYLILIVSVLAGIVGLLIGGVIIYGNFMKTRLMLQERVERYGDALHNEISEIDEKEFLETEAGKDLMALLGESTGELKYQRENFTTSLRKRNHDLLRQNEALKEGVAALLALAGESNPTKISQAIAHAIAQIMLSDLCFVIYLTDNGNQLQLAGGYDLMRKEKLEGGALNKSSIPMLAKSLQSGRPLRMLANSTSADIKGLGDILGLTNPGHLLSVPILTPEKESLGGILLLSPYSDRTWTDEDQAFLSNIAILLVPIIKRSQKVDLQELSQQLDAAHTDNQKSGSVEMESLIAAQDESQRIIEQLQVENGKLRAGKNLQPSSIQIDAELKKTLQEMAHLQNQLAEANMRITDLEKATASAYSAEQAEVIASISQELRQPLSSATGYSDLLLGESVGILGALQRRFVERIKASMERIRSLTDDMIGITAVETGLNDLKPEPVDLNLVIDNAMSYTSTQVREKNISMHLELPKKIALIQADREALQQILIHLLQNAGAATPLEGEIKLKVQTRTKDELEFIHIQVTDTGGGISSEDLSRVFTRLYRADNVLIQGVGDTGVGLSIAKTLTEAQKGRIWVESEQGVGSTFSVLLPVGKNEPIPAVGKVR